MHSDYTPERLQMALAPRPVRYLPSVASTNTAAAEWLAAGAEEIGRASCRERV
jgi:hypothetical protein